MTLKRQLRNAGFDLIENPTRNHKLLQIWRKRPFSKIDFSYANVLHAFSSEVELQITEDDALTLNYSNKIEYKFNISSKDKNVIT